MLKKFILNVHIDAGCTGLVHEDPRGPEAKIMNVIFKGYNRNARPRENPDDTIELDTQFILAGIENLISTFLICSQLVKASAAVHYGTGSIEKVSG